MYRSPNIVRAIKSRRLRCTGHIAKMEEGKNAFKIVTGKTTEESFRKARRRWEDNIRIDLKETYINTRNWIDSAHDRDY